MDIACSRAVAVLLIHSVLLALLRTVSGRENLNYEFVTCGSVIKLINAKHTVRLHSHDVKYGSGSGQQSVTAVPDMDDNNSHWAVKGPMGLPCKRGQPIKCGQEIRFQHTTTACNLHSHLFQSPLSNNQEVSCFGVDGHGDTGDHWLVQCDSDNWEREDNVRFKHKDTGSFLGVSGHKYGRPIQGQREVVTLPSRSGATDWKSGEGVFIKPTDTSSN